MNKLERYRSCIQTLLEKHSQFKSRNEDVENQLFFDPVRDRDRLMRVGWKGLERIYYTVLHFDIKDEKIWLQHNATDVTIQVAVETARQSLMGETPKTALAQLQNLNPPARVRIVRAGGLRICRREFHSPAE
jgi:XisI protein